MPDRGRDIEALRAALAGSPENAKLRAYLAEVLAESGRHEDAVVQYRYLIDNGSADIAARLGLAKALFVLGRASEAAPLADRLQDEPGCPADATLLYARVKAHLGDYERAGRAYRDAIQADPSLTDAEFEVSLRAHGDAPPEKPVAVADALLFDDASNAEPALLEKPAINFSNVGGMTAVKDAIRDKFLNPLAHPDIYKAYGVSAGGGLLMYGPPGVGKTYLARATAGESKANFINIGISDILSMWLGNSERHLHACFEHARKNRPCLIFFDEIDALGGNRQNLATSAVRNVVNQFLSEMDGARYANDGVFVVGATNAPWQLDSAFRRPGRFDRIIFVPPPDETARAEILRVLCEGKPTNDLNFAEVAARTDAFSGADLKAVVDAAVELRLRDAVEQQIVKPLSTRDLLAATSKIKPSTREWFAMAKNYALYANESGIYDDIVRFLRL
ncbi:MAG TPA: AAA family ATPase [Candidatus Cybelea sp.]|jgi:SpoVK/Ycf46/Vps4 family AAA+-type ATPase|nr:AAA family ATPase [Candidatus Cybelea sp.]